MAPEHPGKVTDGHLQRTFGQNLRDLRVARGLSQEALAELIGVHRTYMGGLERGERNPTLKSVERVAAHLDVDPLSLLTAVSCKSSAPGGVAS